MVCSKTVEACEAQESLPARAASFRNPVGRVVFVGTRCCRVMTAQGANLLTEFLATEIAQRWVAEHKIVPTRTPHSIPAELLHVLGIEQLENAGWAAVVEHEPAAFPSYPHEWPPEMFERATRLTLELAMGVLPHAFRLKDGAPWNMLFYGTEPVFVDLLSFERRELLERIWLLYGQFQRTFLLPLLLWRKTGIAPGQHEDRMARQMPGVWIGDSAWAGYIKQIFEAAFGRYCRPVRVEALADSGRWLYVMERVQEKRI
jgi:hypothetical protein